MTTLAIFIQHSIESLRARKEIKGIKIGKEEIKLSPFVEDIILYTENPKNATKKFLEPIHKIRKLGGYYFNIQNLLFLYTNNKLSEKEIKKTIPFIVASKRIKYLDINLAKELKDL